MKSSWQWKGVAHNWIISISLHSEADQHKSQRILDCPYCWVIPPHEDDLEPIKLIKTATSPSACAPLIVLGSMVENAPQWELVASKEALPTFLPGAGHHFGGWKSRTHTTQLERRRRSKSVQIWWLWTDLSQVSDWRLKRAWICAKLGELVLHLEFFDLVSGFEDRLSIASDLIGVLSVRVTVVSAQSNFGRRSVWVVKRCPIEVKFGQ